MRRRGNGHSQRAASSSTGRPEEAAKASARGVGGLVGGHVLDSTDTRADIVLLGNPDYTVYDYPVTRIMSAVPSRPPTNRKLSDQQVIGWNERAALHSGPTHHPTHCTYGRIKKNERKSKKRKRASVAATAAAAPEGTSSAE